MALPLILPRRENDYGYAIIYSMTERAIKPKQPIKRRKKTAKSVKTDMPQPNSVAEAAIFVGSLGMALYAVFAFVMSVVVVAFNDTGAKGVELISLAIFLFGINIVAQSVLVSKELRRVDRYCQRIIAVCMTIAPLLVSVVLMPILLFYNSSDCKYDEVSNIVCDILREVYYIANMQYVFVIVSITGSAYLWFLVKRKDKLFWIYDKSPKNKVANEKIIERSKSFRRIGIMLMTIPVALYATKIIVTIFGGGYNGVEGGWLRFIMLGVIDYFFASMVWIIFIIAGIIFFIKSK